MPRRSKFVPGTKYGRLLAGDDVPGRKPCEPRKVFCTCTCGNERIVVLSNLLNGHTQSCGCLIKENNRKRATHRGRELHPKEWSVWKGIRKRCNNPNTIGYHLYGGKGVSICEQWEDFTTFLNDMGPCPDGCSIDRIDSNGGYNPENCRWATRTQQSRNRVDTVMVEYEGEIVALADLADRYQLKPGTVWERYRKGWTVKAALETPVRKTRRVYQNVTRS